MGVVDITANELEFWRRLRPPARWIMPKPFYKPIFLTAPNPPIPCDLKPRHKASPAHSRTRQKSALGEIYQGGNGMDLVSVDHRAAKGIAI